MAFSAMSASESFSTRFPLKLWRLLNRCNTGAICWTEHGRSIKIDRRRFEREYLMPIDSAFKTSNFSSFVRQLNLYGFRKVINTFRFNQPADAVGEVDIHEYHHPFFRRGNPDLLNRVQRRMKGRKDSSIKQDCDRENSPLVASILKPLNHSAPKLEHIRFDRQPLHIMDVNGQLLRQANFPHCQPSFTGPWSACQSVPKSTPHSLLQTVTIPPTLISNSMTGHNHSFVPGAQSYSSQAMIKSFTGVEPPKLSSTLNIQTTPPIVHPGLPMVDAIHKVLGEKSLSEMVLPPAGTAFSQSSAANALLPVLNSLCSSTTTPNIPMNFMSTINSDAFLSHALSGQSALTLKNSGQPLNAPIFASPHLSASNTSLPTICHSLSGVRPSTNNQLFTATDIPSLSHWSTLQDCGFQPMVNLCPSTKPNPQYIVSPLNSSEPVTYPTDARNDTVSTGDVIQQIYVQSSPENKESNIQSSSVQVEDCLDESVQVSLSQEVPNNSPSPITLSGTSSPLKNQPVCRDTLPSENVLLQNNATSFLQQLSNGGFGQDAEDNPDKSCYTPITQHDGNLAPDFVLPRMKLEMH